MNKNTAIIILNWNGWEDTKDCINSLLNSNTQNFTIFLIDNGSQLKEVITIKDWLKNNINEFAEINDEKLLQIDDPEYDREYGTKIFLIANKDNLGFAKGNNLGINLAIKLGYKYCLLLNNDTIVTPNSIGLLLNFIISKPEIAAVVPQIRYYKPSNKIWNCGGRIIYPGFRKYYYVGQDFIKVPKTGYKKIDFATGCALLINPKVTGLLTEDYFFGEEDFELALRMRKQKKQMYCVFESVIYHKVNASIKRKTDDIGNMILLYTQRLINIKKNYSSFRYYLYFILQFVYSVYLLRLRYRLSYKRIFVAWRKIIFYSNNYATIDKKTFQRITSNH